MSPSAPDPTPHPYAEFLHRVVKPARYVGGEVGSRVRPWTPDVAKICLAFPDVYDIGMSHLGFKILYGILNDDPRTLAERCYAPWIDLEAELRARKLPLVSLESKRPLKDFDVVGFSLQFELTFSNILTMLELGGIPLRSSDRKEDDPLVIAGGPVATHPEPIAPFIDAIVIGDGEENATTVALTYKRLKDEGVPRIERLRALARLGGVYVPSLYETAPDADTGLHVVQAPADKTLPFPVERSLVDIQKYPFPDESPTGGPEAIFDRMSIEIARGCTEGCRFCQAGMIYRPVRERDPQQIVDTVVRAVEKSGQDEVSLTALSTADVSCISPLIKQVSETLAAKKISLGVSSLRAYGLDPDLLDELKRVRGTGLTFAPEAGTQRMRDVINKNVTEDQLLETAERVFSRGWGKMKLYFICGLPTETDEDVLGIIETGKRALEVGRRAAGKGKPAEVTVSVSVHVPKPHTPFQWCALDDLADIGRKQRLLRDEARRVRNLKLKTHDADASVLEGVFARGDRRLADVLEHAWKNGARFDSWDDQLDLSIWKRAFEACSMETAPFLGTLPVTARLPWSHIDVGLEDGFLAREYRKALQSRLSPPCGKVAGAFVHPTTSGDARAETRRLVCYDCGVACDMTKMREERIDFLESLEQSYDQTTVRRLPVLRPDPKDRPPSHRVRFWFEKVGPVALIGHLDLIREIPRVFRRVGALDGWGGVELVYTGGFHPKPDMTFSPALSLGVMSLDEAVDIKLSTALEPDALENLCKLMTAHAPEGLRFTRAERLAVGSPSISRRITGARYGLLTSRRALIDALGADADVEAFLAKRAADVMAQTEIRLRRTVGELSKMVDVRSYLTELRPLGEQGHADVARAGFAGDLVGFEAEVIITGSGAAKPSELAEVAFGEVHDKIGIQLLRSRLVLGDGQGDAQKQEKEEPVAAAVE
ncbi:MAG: TIGR03960 family B12-binding radical SAM protein [Polyangiaceae bacterium]|nr:TIGR03960 family B12-binding radical SAM protein [Polyangiaceae bacterium]